jgi:hypothetical protein
MPDGLHDLATPGKLREQAARARRLAKHLAGDEAEKRLLALADELEARADAMETDNSLDRPRHQL